MNRWPGIIRRVDREQGLARVVCGRGTDTLQALVVDDGATWLRAGRKVHLLFKETEIVVSHAGTAPWPGAFPAVVANILLGQILSDVTMDCSGTPLRALLDSDVVRALGMRGGLPLDVWIPASALALEDREA
jgi:hypothetical protein